MPPLDPDGQISPPRQERTYPVPFRRVWEACLSAVQTRSAWRVVDADPRGGLIRVEVRGVLRGTPRTAEVRIRLDDQGNTVVGLQFTSPGGWTSPRRHAAGLFRRLDAALGQSGHR